MTSGKMESLAVRMVDAIEDMIDTKLVGGNVNYDRNRMKDVVLDLFDALRPIPPEDA